MKYTKEITINQPREKVVELFQNPAYYPEWQEGLISMERLSGRNGEVGSKTKLKYKMSGREIEMIETITTKNLPEQMDFSYDTDGVFNIVENRFEEVDSTTCRYITHQEFQFQSFMMKVIGFFMPGSFKKQSEKYLKDFKEFAERFYSYEEENE